MRFDCANFEALNKACDQYAKADKSEPLILILHTPGQETHRFIVTEHGIVKQDCDRTGERLFDPNLRNYR